MSGLVVRSIARALAPIQSRLVSAGDLPSGAPWLLNRPWNLPAEAVDYPWAYRLVPTVQFCVELYQSTLAATPLKWYVGEGDTKKELPRAPGNICDLWEAANIEQTGYELTEDLVGSLELFGNAYLFKDYMGTQKVQQFWMLNPASVKPVRGPGRGVVEYEVQDGGKVIKVPRIQIVHFKRYDPEMAAVGVSRLQALRLAYETQRDSARFLRLFYQKGGMVAGHYSTENSLDDDDVERLKKQFKSRYQGIENSWDPVFLPKKLAFTRAGLTMEEMQFIESEKLTAAHMYKLFKIPPMLAGDMEGGTGLNSDVAQVSMMLFLRFGVMPAAMRISKKLNEALLGSGEFGFNISCEFDFSNDPVMVEAWLKQAEMWNKATGAPHVSRAEARDHQGLPPRPEAEGLDDILVPTTLTDSMSARAMAEADVKNAENPPAPVILPKAPVPPPVAKARTAEEKRARAELARVRADRRLRAHEGRVNVFARRHFAAQQRRVVSKLKEQSRSWELDDIIRELDDPDAIRKARRLVRGIVSDAGDDAIAGLGLDLAFSLHAADVNSFIADKAMTMVQNIDDTTRGMLRDALSEGIAAGESLGDLTARVDAIFGDRLARSARVARTETAAAFNFGTVEGYRQSGVVEQKEWLTAGDEHVRDTHQQLDGTAVPLDDVFVSSSGARLSFPGDPDCNDAGEVINCRCTLVPVVDNGSQQESAPLPDAIARRLKGAAPSKNGKHPQSLEEWLNA